MTDLNMSFSEQEKVRKEIQHKDAELLRTKLFYKSRRQKVTMNDFEFIAIIGRGAFGEVSLCRAKEGQVVAIKKMNKHEMMEKNQVLFSRRPSTSGRKGTSWPRRTTSGSLSSSSPSRTTRTST